METTSTTRAASPRSVWTGRILSTVAALFLAFDGAIKLIQLPEALEGSASLRGRQPFVGILPTRFQHSLFAPATAATRRPQAPP